MFEPFFRSKEGAARASGIGLELTVCKRFVEIQGAQIGGISRPEGGATFRFTLPPALEIDDQHENERASAFWRLAPHRKYGGRPPHLAKCNGFGSRAPLFNMGRRPASCDYRRDEHARRRHVRLSPRPEGGQWMVGAGDSAAPAGMRLARLSPGPQGCHPSFGGKHCLPADVRLLPNGDLHPLAAQHGQCRGTWVRGFGPCWHCRAGRGQPAAQRADPGCSAATGPRRVHLRGRALADRRALGDLRGLSRHHARLERGLRREGEQEQHASPPPFGARFGGHYVPIRRGARGYRLRRALNGGRQ